jgi:hypothetical protein
MGITLHDARCETRNLSAASKLKTCWQPAGLSRELGLIAAKQINMARFATIDRDTPILLPPDQRNWVPPGHLVSFIIDAIELSTPPAPKSTTAALSMRAIPDPLYLWLSWSIPTSLEHFFQSPDRCPH